ncbi:hypothetical protein GTA62_01840 [Roseobacter sp. HKCCD9010]|uniref:hypothetical protein n=1 Tax=unclassified Roseobacter TaxID=196798 RepID=UPI001492A1CA|nr:MULTISPECIES: hypothetical protein [unclassified Roseobacter]MBF9049395.1 hypothetical protein [Rhodobacterales bacterium HKCCD4356]NNV11395.1 hypothetical protein [Roseobacter sp. HKCCD7357]NNV15579.1 hypothetical protein [Roseobacter sp. HKCCD8768]NNV25039.1 hypothetical protein [Roseobacter sp. HKCCD8192]NNV29296.1 hypothetical protein [Roseobacter sp. HKCCD9061]
MTMTSAADTGHFTRKITYRIPLIGRMAREIVEGDEDTPFYAVAMLVSLWASAFIIFGYAGLIIPALIMVAVMFLTLIRITMG